MQPKELADMRVEKRWPSCPEKTHPASGLSRQRGPGTAGLGLGSQGTFIHRYGDRFREIEGVEYASRTIARAKVRCAGVRGVTWRTMGIERAARLIGRRADLTVCMNVITSHSTARRASQWASVAAVTKRGGFALVVVPSIESEEMVELEYQAKKKNKKPLEHDNGVVERDGAIRSISRAMT